MDILQAVERLLCYGEERLALRDKDFVRNALLHTLRLEAAGTEAAFDVAALTPSEVTRPLVEYALACGLAAAGEEERFADFLLGLVTARSSEIAEGIMREGDGKAALNAFYRLCIDSGYIKREAVSKNIRWDAEGTRYGIEMTINLSKPEKSNKDIAAQQKTVATGYPKCALCRENEGYYGNAAWPARSTLRTFPLTLGDEPYFFQFSPYVYYDQHCIVIHRDHKPMRVEAATLTKLLDFVERYPHYFAGCNASLPIVGGSILGHDHFQGGGHLMPMHKATGGRSLRMKAFPTVSVSLPDWYNSLIRLTSRDKAMLQWAGALILERWQDYSDESVGIRARTGETPHNSLTPVARKSGNTYILDLILRNNRTDAQHPDGIFHAHREYHNIKSEGIGLIEAMGLFILPARLARQTGEVAAYLTGTPYNRAALAEDMRIHADWIEALIARHGTSVSA
ncbi:MAG: galactose-1-phosphate uridylyltransferase, partial [Clostridiales bacterium]|nr:galactose-1-phosphate uridylyltransferase [Clostridiales bacterium]